MKRFIISLVLVVISSFSGVMAQDEIGFDVELVDPTQNHEPPKKGSVLVPSVSLYGNTLYFATTCDGCTLRLLDENDVVVYSTVIPTGTTSLVLPSYLSGEFEIQIIHGNYCFWGYIYL
ncbi:MAG: hypothetical protein IJQ04_02710 [Prevotella sp.]|nr:hypothetical protein [Prevotella sp.]